ncbi:MAG: hypothetical protein AAB267_09400, partial [Candidatus Desantisbacteria bacterium]
MATKYIGQKALAEHLLKMYKDVYGLRGSLNSILKADFINAYKFIRNYHDEAGLVEWFFKEVVVGNEQIGESLSQESDSDLKRLKDIISQSFDELLAPDMASLRRRAGDRDGEVVPGKNGVWVWSASLNKWAWEPYFGEKSEWLNISRELPPGVEFWNQAYGVTYYQYRDAQGNITYFKDDNLSVYVWKIGREEFNNFKETVDSRRGWLPLPKGLPLPANAQPYKYNIYMTKDSQGNLTYYRRSPDTNYYLQESIRAVEEFIAAINNTDSFSVLVPVPEELGLPDYPQAPEFIGNDTKDNKNWYRYTDKEGNVTYFKEIEKGKFLRVQTTLKGAQAFKEALESKEKSATWLSLPEGLPLPANIQSYNQEKGIYYYKDSQGNLTYYKQGKDTNYYLQESIRAVKESIAEVNKDTYSVLVPVPEELGL